MNFKRKPIRNKSGRKKLRDEIGKIHLEILRIRRGNVDELSGNRNIVVGRFHILSVGLYPKLEFVDDNILLVRWLGGKYSHFDWHHNYEKAKEIEKRIIELRGADYKEKLLIRDKLMPTHTELYLKCLLITMRKELVSLKGVL